MQNDPWQNDPWQIGSLWEQDPSLLGMQPGSGGRPTNLGPTPTPSPMQRALRPGGQQPQQQRGSGLGHHANQVVAGRGVDQIEVGRQQARRRRSGAEPTQVIVRPGGPARAVPVRRLAPAPR